MAEETPKRPLARGLGRGLDSLFSDDYRPADEPAEVKRATRTAPIEALVPGPYQPRRRFDDETLGQLAESIARHGLLQPILVRPVPDSPGMFQIVAGERRWRAAQRARLHEVPVVVREMDDRDTLEVALIENIQRQDLSPLEEAEGYRRLIEEFQHTQEVLAKSVGRSRSHITNMLRLLGLPDPVKRLVDDGRLTAGHARALLSAEDPVALAQEVLADGLSVREVERRIAQPKKPQRQPDPDILVKAMKDVDTYALENRLTGVLGMDVEIVGRQRGTVKIKFADLDQLDALIKLLERRG